MLQISLNIVMPFTSLSKSIHAALGHKGNSLPKFNGELYLKRIIGWDQSDANASIGPLTSLSNID